MGEGETKGGGREEEGGPQGGRRGEGGSERAPSWIPGQINYMDQRDLQKT